MRDPLVTLYVIIALVPIAGLLGTRRQPAAYVALLLGLNALLGSLAVLAFPIYTFYDPDKAERWLFDAAVGGALILINATAVLAPPRVSAPVLERIQRRAWMARIGLLLVALVFPIACMEWTATSAVKLGWARQYVPTETRLAEQTEDWRLVHVMSDDSREPDPVLLWRPVARPPYGRQRFKGPDVVVPKPSRVTRVMAYGDSNTDGPADGAWPNRLDAIVRGENPRREVVNAGVTGYSSYQGLQRFREDVDVYAPDVVLVSFGWNDVAPAIGPPDRAFAASSRFRSLDAALIWMRRLLFRYQFYLVSQHYLAPPAADPISTSTYAPRVSLDDYATNLREFVATAREHGAVTILLTRPYRESTSTLEQGTSWRRFVPAYNRVLLDVAAASGAQLVDVQAAFADHADLFVDECHFTQKGHAVMARLVAERLGQSMRGP